MPKKLKRGDPLGFFNIRSVEKLQKKSKGGPFGEIFFSKKKSHRAENTLSPFGPFEFLRWCKNTTSQAFALVF